MSQWCTSVLLLAGKQGIILDADLTLFEWELSVRFRWEFLCHIKIKFMLWYTTAASWLHKWLHKYNTFYLFFLYIFVCSFAACQKQGQTSIHCLQGNRSALVWTDFQKCDATRPSFEVLSTPLHMTLAFHLQRVQKWLWKQTGEPS